MITTTDVANILYRDCRQFGLDVYQSGNVPGGELTTERVVILAKRQTTGVYWNKGYVEVNLCVPDSNGKAQLIRLNELEHEAKRILDNVGEYNDSHYQYTVDSIGIEEDISLKCHYVNARVLFQVLNVK